MNAPAVSPGSNSSAAPLKAGQRRSRRRLLPGSVQRIRLLLPQAARQKLPRRIHLVAIGEQESRRLNRRYRRRDKAANVLSFRYVDGYGEILICPALIRREAREQGHVYDYQLTWMIAHGMIHLAGLHHEQSRTAAEKSNRIEQQILKQFPLRGTQSHHRS